ncbi:MAG: T9SS C-terminal target domain-containing protein, partial [Acidobacteriota bacterium]|nr:T9SS C-terminal target domain-containing protein [Acidobacteriota bacterium]
MKQMSYRLAGLALAVAMLTGGVAPVSTQTNVPGIDKPVIVVTGEITSTVNWTSNFYYVLRGAVFVRDGGTLNIAAGTRVIGEAGSVGTLIVERGGRLNAIGTRTAPIVFTSDQAIGSRARGDWGGIILNGRAPVNLEGGEGAGEGDTGIYGGNSPNDSSGTMRYVRVEYGGTEFSPDNELNGIAFQGVGRGGSYEYIQVHMARDDG